MEKKSRLLVTALRHKPEILNLKLDSRGWTTVSSVLKSLDITKDDLDEIVETNNKKRFEYDEYELKIRASQGHSIQKLEVYKDWIEFIPKKDLYHGTAIHSIDSIMKSGLIPQSRTHVHLSLDIKTALTVGSRHGKPKILNVDAVSMYNDGYKFYQSKNGVILVDKVPSKYIS
jgi:putative RNA 2'-phosphotransferase